MKYHEEVMGLLIPCTSAELFACLKVEQICLFGWLFYLFIFFHPWYSCDAKNVISLEMLDLSKSLNMH